MTVARGQGRATALAAALMLLLFLGTSRAFADNWPAFRGADGLSTSTEKGLPVQWGPDKNVRWRVDLPGKSNGSPIVWGDKVLLLQSVEKDKRRTVMCFSRRDGKVLWQSGVTYAEPESTHPDNPYCSGTPATNGERVVACFGSAGLYCYDLAGKELWHRDLGKLDHMFGNAISPVLVGDLAIVNFGPGEGARLVAVDKRTGEVKWEQQPPKVDESEKSMTPERLGGPAMLVTMPLMQGDKDQDSALSRDEMVAVAETWFDKLDAAKAGKVTRDQFVERLGEAMPPPPGAPGGGDFKPGPMIGPALFAALDADKDASLTRDEMKCAFAGWHAKWGAGKDEPLFTDQVLDGLNAILPPPRQGRGGAGGPGGARGPGGPGGPGGPQFGGAKGPGGSWTTPLLIHAGNRDELIVTFPNRLAAYDPRTGKQLWLCKGLPDSVQSMPLYDDREQLVLAGGGDLSGGTLIAVRPGGSGDVSNSHRLWRLSRLKGTIGSGVVHDGRVYSIASDGFAVCNKVKTGKKLWQKRLEASGDRSASWSSMLLADGRIYVPNQSGDVFVLGGGREFEVLATNSVNEPTNASLAASDGDLLLRTDKALWCIGGQK
jgi:outer membrane protein assembly factor BamB